MKKSLKIGLLGFLTWLIPFVISIPFFSKEGQLLIDEHLFKTIMVVVGSVFGALMLVIYFKKAIRGYFREGIIVGLAWLAINWAFDFAVLLPMSGMSVGAYFIQIGLRYLVLPTMSIAMGYLIENKLKSE
jgi:hypothetical protein